MFIYLFLFITGSVFASFIHVYVTRTIDNESIVKPRSHCMVCNHTLSWYELIPIISYLIQKGRCRKCNFKIGTDLLLTEIFTGLLFVIVYMFYGISYETLLGFVIVLTLISICISDFKHLIILDSTLVVSIALTYVLIFLNLGFKGIYDSFLYGVFAFVLLFVIKILGDAIFKRESLGGGDIKLAFLMGSILPYNMFLFSILIGSCIALPYAIIATNIKKTNEFAFGPFLVIGLLIVFLFQNDIIRLLESILA